jgi:hypothetical protein
MKKKLYGPVGATRGEDRSGQLDLVRIRVQFTSPNSPAESVRAWALGLGIFGI